MATLAARPPRSEQFFDLPPISDDSAVPGTREWATIEWCEERLRRGIRFVTSQVGYDRISEAIDQIFAGEKTSGSSWSPIPARGLSGTRANLVAKIAEDLTAQLTDTRYFWRYSSQNPKYQPQARLSNKSAEHWYTNRLIDLRIGDVIRYYTVAGTGFAHLYYSRRLNDMMLEAVDPRNVFPIDPLTYHTVQDCSGVILRRARTPEYFQEEYDKIVMPDVNGSPGGVFGWISKVLDSPAQSGGPLSKRGPGDKDIPATPTTFENICYLRDSRTNDTQKTLLMGPWRDSNGRKPSEPFFDSASAAPSAPWSYRVSPGAPLYPFQRLIVWANRVLCYDGPAPYWHAKFPLIKFTLNPWSQSWFGKAPLWDCLPLQRSVNANLRVIDDHAAQVAQPALIADRNVSKSEVQKADTRAAGMKIRTNMASGKGITIVPPPPLEPIIWDTIKFSIDMMNKLAGVADPSSMASVAQIPSDDTIDTLMKAMTPGNRLRSRILEGCYKELAEQWLFCHWEFDTLAKRMAMFGPAGSTAEDFDYSPSVAIPDDVPDGDAGDIASSLDALGTSSPRPLYQRARAMLASIACRFDPSSLLNSAAQQDLMKYFLLAKMGYISVFTLLDKMGVQNFAPGTLVIPDDEISRLQLQQQLGIGMLANSQGRKATDSAPPSMGATANGPIIQTS